MPSLQGVERFCFHSFWGSSSFTGRKGSGQRESPILVGELSSPAFPLTHPCPTCEHFTRQYNVIMIQAPPYPCKHLEEGVSRRTFLEQLSLLGASSGILQLASTLQGSSMSQGAPKKSRPAGNRSKATQPCPALHRSSAGGLRMAWRTLFPPTQASLALRRPVPRKRSGS